MLRLLHSADWQLGARFTQFGARAPRLREARLETLRHTLDLARKHEADAFLIAGDLFEDNQVDDALVTVVVELFRAHPDLLIYILPGNHDPFTGPDCVWQRKAFLNAPKNVHVFREAAAVKLGDAHGGTGDSNNAYLIASPLRQKRSTIDPSLKLAELSATLPAGSVKIGITHGAFAIESKHQPNDFPIALNAATHADLDYLAIGHWHNWLADTDSGRIVMPGTPEPESFANDTAGHVALVEITAHGSPPRVQQLPVASLTWRNLAYDFLTPESSRTSLAAELTALTPTAARTVLRVRLHGTVSPAALNETRTWLETALAPFLVSQLVDDTRVALTPAELTDLQTRHPILAQVLADIDRLETLATGTLPTTATLPDSAPPPLPDAPTTPIALPAPALTPPPATAPLTLAEAQELLAPAHIDLAQLTPAFFLQLRQTLYQTLQTLREEAAR